MSIPVYAMSSRDRAAALERHAAEGWAAVAAERRSDVRGAIDNLVRGFRTLIEANCSHAVSRAELQDIIAGSIDVISSIDGQCSKWIDAADQEVEPLDLSELHELLTKVS